MASVAEGAAMSSARAPFVPPSLRWRPGPKGKMLSSPWKAAGGEHTPGRRGDVPPECCVSRRWKRSLRRPHVAAPPERSPEGNFRAMAGVASFSKRLKVLAPLQNAGSDALVNAASPCQ